jgi:hypothetical protein
MDQRIEILKLTDRIVRAHLDIPMIWKLNQIYLDCLCEHLHVEKRDDLIFCKFLEASIDFTSRDGFCIGFDCSYPLIRID